jgi:hypothetical protein
MPYKHTQSQIYSVKRENAVRWFKKCHIKQQNGIEDDVLFEDD